MKKVLFTATVDSHILQFHIPYLKWFKEQGYEVHVATNGDEKIPYCDVKHQVTFERSPIKINNLKAIKQLRKIINTEKFDIIHTHTPMGSVVTRIAAMKARKKYNTKVIYTAHGFHFFKGAPLLNWMMFYPVEKWLSKYTDCLITINEEDYNLAKNKFKAKQIELVHGVGVDENKFNFKMSEEEKHNLRKELGLKDDDFVMIYPAELSKRKNQGMLLNVMKMLKDENNNNIKLLLPGKDSMNGKYQQMAKDLEIDENVRFLGYRKDIPKLMKISNLAVSTSKQEGLPVNLIEAMMCGLPIVATDCRGNRDLNVGQKNINIINNEEEIKRKILLYYEKILQRGNKEKFTNKDLQYSLSNIMKKYEKIYLGILKKNILHILASNKYSGAENVVISIINAFRKETKMFYCSPIGEIKERLKKEKIDYISIRKLNRREIKKVIKKYNPDIIHAHDYRASVIVAISGYRGKIISHLHNNSINIKRWSIKSILYNITIKRYNKIVVVSKSILEEAVFGKKIKNKSCILYNYVDEEKIKKMAENKMQNSEYNIGYIGRFSEAKDPLEFVEIVNEIRKVQQDIKVIMVGDGELKEYVINKIEELKLQENIKVIGFLENPYQIMKKCNIVIMPSKWEGFGLVAIECIILGVPVLTSNVGGFKEIFKDNQFFICNNRQEFIDKYFFLLKNKEKMIISVDKYTNYDKWKNQLLEIYK